MFKKILVPVDTSQSDAGEDGLKAAAELAGKAGGHLILLNVVGDIPNLVADQLPSNYLEETDTRARNAMEKLAEKHKLAAGSYEIRTTHGKPYSKILAAAEAGGADLIVLASQQPGAADYLLGSTAAKVVRHAHCSVMIVRE